MLLRWGLAVLLAMQTVVVASTAQAQSQAQARPSAAELKTRGDAAMDQGAFAAAILEYRSSYELSDKPALLYNIASAYERLHDYPHALSYFERFASLAPAELRARVPRLQELIASVRERLARVIVRCRVPGARVLVRGDWEGTTPLAKEIFTTPGGAHVEVVADGYRPYVQDVTLAAGSEVHIDAVLLPEIARRPASSGPETRASSPVTSTWWFWTGVGVVFAGAATAAVVALSHPGSSSRGAPSGQTAAPLVSW